jgi:hypothetical protein
VQHLLRAQRARMCARLRARWVGGLRERLVARRGVALAPPRQVGGQRSRMSRAAVVWLR